MSLRLPYIDHLDVTVVTDPQTRVLEASLGKYSAAFRAIGDPTDNPFLMEQAFMGGYHLHAGAVNGAGGWPCWLVNQNFNDRSMGAWEEIRALPSGKALALMINIGFWGGEVVPLDATEVFAMAYDGWRRGCRADGRG